MERALRKTRVGMVVSNKMDKTIVVAIMENVRHPVYKKVIKRRDLGLSNAHLLVYRPSNCLTFLLVRTNCLLTKVFTDQVQRVSVSVSKNVCFHSTVLYASVSPYIYRN